jgi:hypothetical protein
MPIMRECSSIARTFTEERIGNSSEEKRAILHRSFCNYSFSLSRKRSFFVEEIMGRNDDNNQRLLFKESISSLLSEYFSHHAVVLEFVNSLTELCFSRELWWK